MKSNMRGWSRVAAVLCITFGIGTSTMADECRDLIERIDNVLTKVKLRPRDAALVRELRSKGIALQREGRYTDCMGPLKEVAVLLGIDTARQK